MKNTPQKYSLPHSTTYPRFLWRCIGISTDGGLLFYAWMTFLTGLMLVGVHATTTQFVEGMGVTSLTDHVSWGMYISNFTYVVGLAAGGVMMVIPAYLYDDREMHDVVIVGEVLAIASIMMAVMFVAVDMGRPDRFWHILPFVGRFNWPISMLTWDVIVLNGYLLINLHVCGYLIYTRFLGKKPNPRWYVPFVFLSIFWAISIHTVTAFLYSGLGGRPFWNSAVLAPRFLASAFVSGPAFIVLSLGVIQKVTPLKFGVRPVVTLIRIVRVTAIINLFLLLSEVFTEFYTGSAHVGSAKYLYFGLHGHNALVPWIWTAIILNTTCTGIFVFTSSRKRMWLIQLACIGSIIGIWIEKGMGLIVPGFVPSTLHEIVEYVPNTLEWKVTVGIWAFGLLIFTLGLKIAIAVFSGNILHEEE
jgi:molybdopterin-containing oxidoreductase family membrane subunit